MNLFLALALSTAPAAPSHPAAAPPFDQVLAEAATAGTPILLDVVTTWCAPCRMMAKDVFPHPKVVKAMEGLRFVSYDAERGLGVDVAQRFHIDSYPTVMLLTADGVPVGQLQQQSPDAFVKELEALKPLGLVRGTGDPAPNAPAAAWYVAGLSASSKDPVRALTFFERTVAADPKNAQGYASRAAAASIALKVDRATQLARAKAHAEFLAAWPASVEASSSLKALARSVRDAKLDRALLDGARAQVVQAAATSDDADVLNNLIYLVLEQGDVTGAKTLAARLEVLAPEDPSNLDTVAEVAFRAGDRARAVAVSKKAVALAKPDERGELAENLARFEKEDPSASSDDAPPEVDSAAAFQEAQANKGRAARAVSAQLVDACPRPNTQATVVLRVWFGKDGKVHRAVAFEPQAPAPLLRCLERASIGVASPVLSHEPWADVPVYYRPSSGH